jgi:KDO2-lipid IV(A) lauroyltransferase
MTAMNLSPPPKSPRHWLSWFVVGVLWLLGKLPAWLGRALVAPLGPLMFHLMKHRRWVAERNLERCFPEHTAEERAMVLRRCFSALARTLVESAWSWSGSKRFVVSLGDVVGLEHLEAALDDGKGVLLVTSHTTCLEIGGCILIHNHPGVSGVYRPLKNPVIEWYQTRGRLRYADRMISKRDARNAVRLLRKGGVLWYAPDQDFGLSQSVFAPFFGISTATLLATHRLPRMSGCAVVPMFPHFDVKKGRYVVRVLPALENFPTDDPVADLGRVNALMEENVRLAPEQYWWIHRRFKTRPEGEAPFYD